MSIRTRMKAHARTDDIGANISIVDGAREIIEYGATPNAAVTANLWALCIDTATSDVYINTDGATAWSKILD